MDPLEGSPMTPIGVIVAKIGEERISLPPQLGSASMPIGSKGSTGSVGSWDARDPWDP